VNRLRSALLLAAVSGVAACGDDNTGPTTASVAGTYHTTRAEVTFPGGEPFDALALGLSVDIVLTPQGTTTGTLVVPAPFTENGVDEDLIDLTGTFTVTGNTLRFQGQGDSFIPEVEWTIGNGTLTTIFVDIDGNLEMTLTRS